MSSRARNAEPSPPKDMSAHLSLGSLDWRVLREYYRQQLIDLLNERGGSKTVVLDKALEPQMNLIGDLDFRSFFRSIDGVEALQPLTDDVFSPATHIVYIVKPTIANMRLIASHIHAHQDVNKMHVYSVVLTPRKTLLCESQLSELGVLDSIGTINEFQLEFIPVENDCLSMEIDSGFRELFLEHDSSLLFCIARSLMKLQTLYGLFPVVKGKGRESAKVWGLMQRMKRDYPINATKGDHSIGGLLLLDRSIDLVSPLLTQSTYEGMIDEIFHIQQNIVELPADLLTQASQALMSDESERPYHRRTISSDVPATSDKKDKQKMKKLPVTNMDSIFAECRDLAFKSIPNYLHRKAESIAMTYDERDHISSNTRELGSYVKRFKVAHNEHSLLSTHTALTELINDTIHDPSFTKRLDVERSIIEGTDTEQCEEFIESLIAKQASLTLILRLLGLMSLITGIRSKKFDSFKRDILQTYGYDKLIFLQNLERLGLLATNAKKRPFSSVKKVLRLINYDRPDPTDISYVYSGYAPMLVRLVESAMRPGWKRMDEIMTLIQGTGFEYRQDIGHTQDPSLTIAEGQPVSKEAAPMPSQSAPAQPAPAPMPSENRMSVSGLRGLFGGKSRKEEEAPALVAAPSLIQSLSSQSVNSVTSAGHRRKQIVFVLILGGLTFAELNALRSLSYRDDHDYDYVVLATKLINGNTLIQSLNETILDDDVEKKLKRSIFSAANMME